MKNDNSEMGIAALLTLMLLGGCSTIVEGRSQQLTVNTYPAGAICVLERHGETLAKIESTPSSILIEKTKYDINVTCDKPGFQQATYLNKSGSDGVTFGNIILGGGIGWAIDPSTGSDNKYDSIMNITLVPTSVVEHSQPVTVFPAAVQQ